MAESLGEKLKAAREERGISISEVAEQTRISPLYLECIDRDDYKTLPGGIFNKGFVKSYAKYVGLDENEALQDYSRIVAATETSTESEAVGKYRPEVLTDDNANASSLPTIIFALVILGLMTGGILFLVDYIRNRPETPAVVTNTNTNTNQATNSNAAPATEQTAAAPAMDAIKVEFKTTDEISLTAISDGKRSSTLVTKDKVAEFEPKENLKLSYARSRAEMALLSINGREIKLPIEPENPRRNAIEFEINKDNLSKIWQSGSITFGEEAAASQTAVQETTAQPVPASTVAPPASTPAPARSQPPTPRPTVAATNTTRPRTSPTPIIIRSAPTNRNVN